MSTLSKYPATRRFTGSPSTPTPAPKTPADFAALAESRKRAAILAEQIRRQREIDRISSEPLAAQSIDPAEMLTNEELLELNQQTLRAQHIREQSRRSLQVTGQFLLSHPEFPADEASGKKLGAWLESRGLNATWNNLQSAYDAMLKTGEIVPNYTRANRNAHEEHIDILRANGINVQPVDFSKMSKEEIEQFVAAQPHSSREEAFLTTPAEQPEPQFEVPAVPTIEDFEPSPAQADPYSEASGW
jgi:hypothetical protein